MRSNNGGCKIAAVNTCPAFFYGHVYLRDVLTALSRTMDSACGLSAVDDLEADQLSDDGLTVIQPGFNDVCCCANSVVVAGPGAS